MTKGGRGDLRQVWKWLGLFSQGWRIPRPRLWSWYRLAALVFSQHPDVETSIRAVATRLQIEAVLGEDRAQQIVGPLMGRICAEALQTVGSICRSIVRSKDQNGADD